MDHHGAVSYTMITDAAPRPGAATMRVRSMMRSRRPTYLEDWNRSLALHRLLRGAGRRCGNAGQLPDRAAGVPVHSAGWPLPNAGAALASARVALANTSNGGSAS